MNVRVSLAGRVTIASDGVLIDERRLPGRHGRLVFADVVSERGRAVPRDELAGVLWGERPPPTWEKPLGGISSKLRALLGECGIDGAEVLTSAFGCYRLELPKETTSPGLPRPTPAFLIVMTTAARRLVAGQAVRWRVCQGYTREMAAPAERGFEHLREHSIGLPGVLFQSVTHMAPGAAITFSILVSVQFAGPVLPLSVLFGLLACLLVANSIGQLAKQIPSAGGLYAYVSRALGPRAGFFTGWAFLLFEPMVFPFIILVFATATEDVVKTELGINLSWWPWVLAGTAIVFLLTDRAVRISANAGIALGLFEIAVFVVLSIWMLAERADTLDLRAFDPSNAPGGAFNAVFKGMVFAVLAFIGFEASAPPQPSPSLSTTSTPILPTTPCDSAIGSPSRGSRRASQSRRGWPVRGRAPWSPPSACS